MPPERPTHPPPGPRDAAGTPPPRPGGMIHRATPWIDLLAKLLTAVAAALAIWKTLG